jgi:hypothetical protein
LLTKWGTISSCNEQFLVLADIFEAATILLPLTIFSTEKIVAQKTEVV